MNFWHFSNPKQENVRCFLCLTPKNKKENVQNNIQRSLFRRVWGLLNEHRKKQLKSWNGEDATYMRAN